ncbi:MAG: dephospho-CoA kinase [Actinobacteria bacterium]|nr:dephospho-CoA kinase [Actinomycetota bacterium]
MLVVGLTGGVGAGKSTVSQMLADHGAVIVDADAIARAVVEPGTPGFQEVLDAFGDEVLYYDGMLDRKALAALVFRDPVARGKLESIIHPLVRQQSDLMTALADDDAIVVHDVPLLAETGRTEAYDVIVVVDAPEDVRIARLLHSKGWDVAAAKDRIAAQSSSAQRLAIADEVVENTGDIAELQIHVDALWERLKQRATALEQ